MITRRGFTVPSEAVNTRVELIDGPETVAGNSSVVDSIALQRTASLFGLQRAASWFQSACNGSQGQEE
jgi:hypothetical protein